MYPPDARLMCEQKSPVIIGKVETAFAQLDRLGLGKDGEDVTDVQLSLRRAQFLTSVPLAPSE